MTDKPVRSEQACPVCGRHELAVDPPPRLEIMGYLPANELLGMGDVQSQVPPAIVCLACGTRWTDLDAFRENRPEPRVDPQPGPSPGPRRRPARRADEGPSAA